MAVSNTQVTGRAVSGNQPMQTPFEIISEAMVGGRVEVPVRGGFRRYINLDNAATTPAFSEVRDAVNRVLEVYSSAHRGTGWKSMVTTGIYEHSRSIIGAFVGFDPDKDVVIFGKNTTDVTNLLASRLDLGNNGLVLLTDMEHHSNDLPWRRRGKVGRVPLDRRGVPDLGALEHQLQQANGRVKLVAVSGASNVTGHVPDIQVMARLAHRFGARIFVDCAQLAARRPVRMHAPNAEPIDFVAFSGHKLYAPFGIGVMVGPKEIFARGLPYQAGGGTVRAVTRSAVYWADPPGREEAGSPNVIGAVALAQACRVLERIGWPAIIAHDRALLGYALDRLRELEGITVYGAGDGAEDAVGVVSFNLANLSHGLCAAALSWEHGIAVRNGCFCAQPFLAHLMKLDQDQIAEMVLCTLKDERSNLPGMVRLSLAIYNTPEDIDAMCEALVQLRDHGPALTYEFDCEKGFYLPAEARLCDAICVDGLIT
jgi:cysteine desulfurase/selenocysteine lyase